MNNIYTEYTNLTDKHKAWLDGCGVTWYKEGQTFLNFIPKMTYVLFEDKEFSQEADLSSKFERTHIPTGDEFCEKVAEILGIDKPTFGLSTAQINRLIDDANDQVEKDLELYPNNQFVDTNKMVTYPHKTYRVLDSLDGIPLDTRIPLSKWIPPIESEVAVISNKRMIGVVKAIKNNGVLLYAQGARYEEMISLDGHWMRIV